MTKIACPWCHRLRHPDEVIYPIEHIISGSCHEAVCLYCIEDARSRLSISRTYRELEVYYACPCGKATPHSHPAAKVAF